jgi:hypothetical protein
MAARLIRGGIFVFRSWLCRLFAEQVIVEYLARDGSGGARTETAILDYNCQCNFRFFRGRIS